jgi:hypothetical protein
MEDNMEDEFEKYDAFAKHMKERFPKMFAQPYGGFCCGEGWWPILESLCENVQSHIDWNEKTRLKLQEDNPYEHPIPVSITQVTVAQIKEKFGGLRFYYDGGDDYIRGLVSMAESWAEKSCETCGAPGTSGGKGWIKTLCPTHRAESDARYEERFKDDKDLQKSILEGMLGEAE